MVLFMADQGVAFQAQATPLLLAQQCLFFWKQGADFLRRSGTFLLQFLLQKIDLFNWPLKVVLYLSTNDLSLWYPVPEFPNKRIETHGACWVYV